MNVYLGDRRFDPREVAIRVMRSTVGDKDVGESARVAEVLWMTQNEYREL
jgi:hypothetical protein